LANQPKKKTAIVYKKILHM